jgi:hypothetical protein
MAGVDCELAEMTAYTCATKTEDVERVAKEVEAASSLGLGVAYHDELELPFVTLAAISLPTTPVSPRQVPRRACCANFWRGELHRCGFEWVVSQR